MGGRKKKETVQTLCYIMEISAIASGQYITGIREALIQGLRGFCVCCWRITNE